MAEKKITLSEFRAWLDGLLAGRDMEREALPTSDQWKQILAELDRIHNPIGDATRMMIDADLMASFPGFRYPSTALPSIKCQHEWTEMNTLTGRVRCAKCWKDWGDG